MFWSTGPFLFLMLLSAAKVEKVVRTMSLPVLIRADADFARLDPWNVVIWRRSGLTCLQLRGREQQVTLIGDSQLEYRPSDLLLPHIHKLWIFRLASFAHNLANRMTYGQMEPKQALVRWANLESRSRWRRRSFWPRFWMPQWP